VQFGRHFERQAFERQLDRLGQRVAAGRQRVSFGHLHNQAAARADHDRRDVLRGDDVRHDGLSKERVGIREIGLPERSPLVHHRILARDAVHQHVETPALTVDPIDQRLDLRFDGVIDANGDRRAAGGGDHLRGLFDRFRAAIRRGRAADTSTSAVHQRAGFAERARDAPAGAARGAGDQGDLSGERWGGGRHGGRL